MSRKTDALDRGFRELDPAGEEPVPEYLLTLILEGQRVPEQSEVARPRTAGWRRRRVLVPAAAAVAFALALVIGLPGGGQNGKSEATSALDNVAAAAAAEPPTPALPYLSLKTRALSVNTASAGGATWSVYDAELREEWTAPDGSGQVRVKAEPPTFVGPGDRTAWEEAGSPNFLPQGFNGSTTEKEIPAGRFEDAANLPADPEALAQRLRAEAEESHKSAPVGARMLELIAEDLRNPAVTPQQRATLYRAAQEVPGVEYLGQASDPEGRQGLAVGITSGYSGEPTMYSLIYDPKNTEVLAYEVEAQHPVSYADSEGPLVISATVYLDSGSAEAMPPQG